MPLPTLSNPTITPEDGVPSSLFTIAVNLTVLDPFAGIDVGYADRVKLPTEFVNVTYAVATDASTCALTIAVVALVELVNDVTAQPPDVVAEEAPRVPAVVVKLTVVPSWAGWPA